MHDILNSLNNWKSTTGPKIYGERSYLGLKKGICETTGVVLVVQDRKLMDLS